MHVALSILASVARLFLDWEEVVVEGGIVTRMAASTLPRLLTAHCCCSVWEVYTWE
jgi:hypothetical protein